MKHCIFFGAKIKRIGYSRFRQKRMLEVGPLLFLELNTAQCPSQPLMVIDILKSELDKTGQKPLHMKCEVGDVGIKNKIFS